MQPGGTVSVTVEASQFKGANLEGLDVQVDVTVGGGELKLGGTLDAGMAPDGSIDFDAKLSLTDPFDYHQGDVSATMKPGGTVSVTVEASQFKYANLEGLDVQVDVTVGGGSSTWGARSIAGMAPDGSLDFDAKLSLTKPFNYRRRPSGGEHSGRVDAGAGRK